jgi:glycosyltransferase involved in cell wall biosynthesis
MPVQSSPPHLLHAFPTFRVGGAQVRFAAIANHFGRQFRHTLVAMDGRYDCRERLDSDLSIDRLNPVIRKANTLGNIGEFRRVLREARPDTLITYNWGSIEWAMANWLDRVRHLHIEDGFGPDEAERQLLRRIWTRRIVLARSTVIVPSIRLQTIATQIWKLDATRVRYIPNGIDCARFSGAHATSPIATTGSGPLVGTVAALRREKNIERLLRTFGRVRARQQCRLVIVGDGPERAALERVAAELGIASDVTFAGHMANPEQVYCAFDIFALSSYT